MSAVKEKVDLSSVVGISEHIKNMILENTELGSRLVSLLLVNSGNADEIISSLNNTKKKPQSVSATSVRAGNRRKSAVSKPQHSKYSRKSMDYTYKKPIATVSSNSEDEEDSIEDETTDSLLLRTLEKRRKNSEASARFRNRKKQKREENLKKLEELNGHIDELNKKVDTLLQENRFWKSKLDDINEQKSKQLLEQIKRKNGICL
ncbi:Transcriptional activator of sulfur metabolism MET28 [Nakaseomyces bracarensis]|uniref:Transcriptional activator of sulfur metabolism MET28 n=1 Tax=Nakaseomyces bracarensis TaxID=273131 RepID=A0ABR4NVD8_9SACH